MATVEERVNEFLKLHKNLGRPIVVVTSGGTQVPLEHNMVRFIENFSKGERGALSTEYFLARGYSVIFLHRKESKLPFTKVFSKLVSPTVNQQLLSRLYANSSSEIALAVHERHRQALVLESECCKLMRKADHYLDVEFVTLKEYLHLLELLAKALAPFGPRACFFLAAAVSDFFIPDEALSQHKIQSNTGLSLELSQVPKLLGVLRKSWAPHAFVVSFKLETDPNILLEKAYRALDNYDVHFVVANLLNTRREECILVSKGICESDVCLPADSYSKIKITRGTVPNLEANLIETIEKAHVQFMLREYGVFSNQNSRTKQAALEVEVMRGVARALEDPIAITVRSYTTLADKMWSELDTWDHKNDSCAESVHQEDRDGTLAVLVGNVGLSALVMAAVAWAANTCRK